jgi:acyl-CoA dehydrogenase
MTPSPYYTDEHHTFRSTLRRFVDQEIAPHAEAWDEAKSFPRELYAKAAQIGLLGLGFPEEYGGTPADPFYSIITCEELARPGCGGISAGLMSHTIALPPVAKLGSDRLRAKVVTPTLRGETIAALAVTEPGGGSDVANLTTTARREGDHYLLNGSKTFITSGIRADFYTVAARTGEPGAAGLSLFVVEKGSPGLSTTPLEKMGWWASDTATVYFDDCRVPAENLIGDEGSGFFGLMLNFNQERLGLAANAYAFAQVCYQEAVAWAQQRVTFGKPLITRQVIRHKLVDMATRLEATRGFLESVAYLVHQGESPVAQICMLKNFAVETMEICAREAVQILGGAGYIRGAKCERIFRETKVIAIGGGATEIMKDLASRQLGW